MTADKEALRAILPELEKTGEVSLAEADQTLATLLAALYGATYATGETDPETTIFRAIGQLAPMCDWVYARHRDRCPDVDLSAADALVRDVGFSRFSHPPMEEGDNAYCSLWEFSKLEAGSIDARHPTSEPLAILIALTRAKLALAEQETVDA